MNIKKPKEYGYAFPVTAIIVLFAILFLCERKITVEWGVVEDCEATTAVKAEGYIAEMKIPLAFVKSGILEKIIANEGAHVHAGDTLAVLDNRQEAIETAKRSVEVEIAGLNLERVKKIHYRKAEENLNRSVIMEAAASRRKSRNDSLFVQGSITRAELEESKKDLDVQQSQRLTAEIDLEDLSIELQLREKLLSKAQLLLRQSKAALSESILRAPTDGKVFRVLHCKGEYIAPGTPILLFCPSDTLLNIEVFVPRNKALNIHSGQGARVTIQHGNDKKSLEQTVRGVVPGRTGGESMVIMTAPAREAWLRVGMKVMVEIFIDTPVNSPVIDRKFVQVLPDGESVFIKKGGCAKRQYVNISDIGNGLLLVNGGITAGDTVIYSKGLRDGRIVELGRRIGSPEKKACIIDR